MDSSTANVKSTTQPSSGSKGRIKIPTCINLEEEDEAPAVLDPFDLKHKEWVHDMALINDLYETSRYGAYGSETEIRTLRDDCMVSSNLADVFAYHLIKQYAGDYEVQRTHRLVDSGLLYVNASELLDGSITVVQSPAFLPSAFDFDVDNGNLFNLVFGMQHAFLLHADFQKLEINYYDSLETYFTPQARVTVLENMAQMLTDKYDVEGWSFHRIKCTTQLGNDCVIMSLLNLRAKLILVDPSTFVDVYDPDAFRLEMVETLLQGTPQGQYMLQKCQNDPREVLRVLDLRTKEQLLVNAIFKKRNEVVDLITKNRELQCMGVDSDDEKEEIRKNDAKIKQLSEIINKDIKKYENSLTQKPACIFNKFLCRSN